MQDYSGDCSLFSLSGYEKKILDSQYRLVLPSNFLYNY